MEIMELLIPFLAKIEPEKALELLKINYHNVLNWLKQRTIYDIVYIFWLLLIIIIFINYIIYEKKRKKIERQKEIEEIEKEIAKANEKIKEAEELDYKSGGIVSMTGVLSSLEQNRDELVMEREKLLHYEENQRKECLAWFLVGFGIAEGVKRVHNKNNKKKL